MEIARAGYIACEDPTVGSQMNMSLMGRKLLTAFTKDGNIPSIACSTLTVDGELETLIWDGRSAEAFLKMSQRLWLELTDLKGVPKRIIYF